MNANLRKPSKSRRFEHANVPLKRISHVLFHCLLAAGVSQLKLAHAQDAGIFDDDSLPFDGNGTLSSLFPTVIDPETPQPTATPTAPTATPSARPTNIVSENPSNFPTSSPSHRPTATVAPSGSPSATFQPSNRPSVSPRPTASMQPSAAPTRSPTAAPTTAPSASPSVSPSLSQEPTISAEPTISFAPSLSKQPSDSPSAIPSDSPSNTPTLSSAPSMAPSVSNAPTVSIQPSANPTVAPSAAPTNAPTASPTTSEPTAEPSASPTDSPSSNPTSMPTLTVRTVIQTNVFMELEGLPSKLNPSQEKQWIEVTENHIWRYFDEVNEQVPGVLPVNVSRVYGTLVKTQAFTSTTDGWGRLEIEYVQAIDYGLFETEGVNEDAIRNQIFVTPFEYDAQSYIVDLITTWDLDEWVELVGINVGPTESPTPAPTRPPTHPEDEGLSERAIRWISASIVLASILVVTFLFWDRHHKEKVYMQAHARDFETMEYDNAGQPIDWRNPYSPSGGPTPTGSPDRAPSTPPQDRGTERSASSRTTVSTVPAAATTTPNGGNSRSNSRHSRVTSAPKMPTRDSVVSAVSSLRSSAAGPGSHAFGTPPQRNSNDHARHISDITDLASSDYGTTLARSDRGSDGAADGANMLSTLPTISDERYEPRAPWSPLYIAEEDYVTSGSQDDDSNVNPSVSTKSNNNKLGNSMSGFQMQVQELE